MHKNTVTAAALSALMLALAACGVSDDSVIVGENNGAITGAWVIIPDSIATDPPIYFISDGFGNITEHGLFDQATLAGTYAVMNSGSVSIILDTTGGAFTIPGYMITNDIASFSYSSGGPSISGYIRRVTNLAGLSGSISGSLTETSFPYDSYAVSLTVSTSGNVTGTAVGSANVLSGKAYQVSGENLIFLRTDWLGLSSAYDQILIWGSSLPSMQYEINSNLVSGTASLF